MTSNEARAETLVGALRAGIARDREALRRVVHRRRSSVDAGTVDHIAGRADRRPRSPRRCVLRDALDVTPLDVGGDYACVEWTVDMTHSGTITLGDQRSIEPSGIRVTLHGVTVAEFHGDRICSLRQYWDEFAVLEQLGVLTGD